MGLWVVGGVELGRIGNYIGIDDSYSRTRRELEWLQIPLTQHSVGDSCRWLQCMVSGCVTLSIKTRFSCSIIMSLYIFSF